MCSVFIVQNNSFPYLQFLQRYKPGGKLELHFCARVGEFLIFCLKMDAFNELSAVNRAFKLTN